MRQRITAAIVMVLLLSCVGHAGEVPAKSAEDAATVVNGNNVFAFDLYSQLSKQEGQESNVFFSPYSVSTALAMTYAGAKGKTAEQMASTLHFELPQERLSAGFGQLMGRLNAKGKNRPYELATANALWGQKGFSFFPKFVKSTESQYSARFEELDFRRNPDEARQTINAWVEKETQNKIERLLNHGDITKLTRLVLTNAIYFKAPWEKEFHKEGTKPADFTLKSGKKVKADMMHKYERLSYREGGHFQLAAIGYRDDALSLIVLLPEKNSTLAKLESSLSSANLAKWLEEMRLHDVDLKLPKFKTTSRFDLGNTLSKMGMTLPFTAEADFSGISSEEPLFISKVIHKAYVDVNEKGTEAAAATAVGIAKSAAPPPAPRATFHADRPFVFMIRESQTGSILFMGRLCDPTAKSE